MRDVFILCAFVIKLLCLVMFVITLKPNVIRTVHALSKADGRSAALSADGCIIVGAGMRNSPWRKALADCINP
jgi:hypothetical protein